MASGVDDVAGCGAVESLPPTSNGMPASATAPAAAATVSAIGPPAVGSGAPAHRTEIDLGRLDLLGQVPSGLAEAVVQAHAVTSGAGDTVRTAESAGGGAGSASSTASRREAACALLLTVPGAMSSVVAISASLRSS